MNENVALNESIRMTPGAPGTGEAVKTGAGYRNAPHTFAAHHEPDGSVLLEIQQSYTGKRQWFRFTSAEWAQLTANSAPSGFWTHETTESADGEAADDVADEIALNRIESSACDQ